MLGAVVEVAIGMARQANPDSDEAQGAQSSSAALAMHGLSILPGQSCWSAGAHRYQGRALPKSCDSHAQGMAWDGEIIWERAGGLLPSPSQAVVDIWDFHGLVVEALGNILKARNDLF